MVGTESEIDPQNNTESILPAIPEIPMDEPDESDYQQAARGRIVAFPFALGLVGLGLLLLLEPEIEGLDVTFPVAALILIAAMVITNLFRFFASGRRERGLFFLALSILVLGAALALMSFDTQHFSPGTWWPVIIIGQSGALLLTYLFERHQEQGLVKLATLVLLAGIIAFMVTQDMISSSLLDTAGNYWPLLLAFLGVTLVPLAMRRPLE